MVLAQTITPSLDSSGSAHFTTLTKAERIEISYEILALTKYNPSTYFDKDLSCPKTQLTLL